MNIIKKVNKHYAETRELINKEKFVKDIFPNSVIVFDNNALLDPLRVYMLNKDVFSMLEQIRNRTYIPFITQIEYMNNERTILEGVRRDIQASTEAVEELTKIQQHVISKADFIREIEGRLLSKRNKKFTDRNEKNEDFFDKTDEYANAITGQLSEVLDKIEKELTSEIKKIKKNLNKEFYWGNVNPVAKFDQSIQEELYKWIDLISKGEPYSYEKLTEYENKIVERYEAEISPGYKDKNKDENRNPQEKFIKLGSLRTKRSFGDAIFWLDTLDYIRSNELERSKFLIIVSNETKADWVEKSEVHRLNKDMIIECFTETGLLPIKVSFTNLLKFLTDVSEDDIKKAEIQLEPRLYSFYLYGEEHFASKQSEMMEKVFRIILPKVDASNYGIPCMIDNNIEYLNTNFDSNFSVSDMLGNQYRVGTSLNFEQKLRYIYDLLDNHDKGSAPQLKFIDKKNQDIWREICRRKK
ncbi:PIN-like domain-containing protein [Streptococcus iners]|uniref:PIN-like domain-containing protein n=1 Tax=Streptococcus iners TaxID=3028084 RepID=A0AA96VL22_9STRE|nr:PIN-like domain-containing protein [Streptococcus sp. 29887]MCK4024986.1 hypothetical protein [Streptococcus suis]WNY50937.1 PIN-like domain-containing protein [Streptococcus sp. 29887]